MQVGEMRKDKKVKGKKERSKLEGGSKREGMRKRKKKGRIKREEEGVNQGKLEER